MKRALAVAISVAMMFSAWPVSAAGPVARRSAGLASTTGTITGTATSSTGQTLSNFAVHVRNLQTGALAGSTTSNGVGRFSFAGLNPGRYVVEVASQSGPIVGSSSPLDLTAGATVTLTVNTAAATGAAFGGSVAQAGGGGGGPSKAVIITTIAAAAGIAAAIAIAANGNGSAPTASPSR
jgi:hypothetical protein